LFPTYISGVKSGNDLVAIAPTREELYRRLELVKNSTNNGQVLDLFGKLKSGQTADKIKNDVIYSNGKIVPISFRPFDTRWTYYSGVADGWNERPRPQKIMGQLSLEQETLDGRNIGLVFTAGDTSPNEFSMIFVSETIIDNRFTAAQTKGNAFVAPLYLYDETKSSWKQNFDHICLAKLIAHMSFRPTPIQVFDYSYGVLNDPNYRKHFNGFLKRDYPSIPIINNPFDKDNPHAFYVSEECFHIYVDAGRRLRRLHLQYDKVIAPITLEPNNTTNLIINKIKYENSLLHINKITYINGISEDIWNFRIAGRQVLDEWFKSHKGESLTLEDFKHVSSVVGLVTETIKIQNSLMECHHGIE
jgi:predicted helicase